MVAEKLQKASMKIKFTTQAFQLAVQAVVDCFAGQTPAHGGVRYRMDPGARRPTCCETLNCFWVQL